MRASQIEVANDRRAEILREFKRRHTLPDGRRVEHVEVTPRVRRETGYKRSPWLELWRVTYAGGETREYWRLEPRDLPADEAQRNAASERPRMEHCQHGHELHRCNVLVRDDGRRECRTCRRERDRARHVKRKAARVATAEGGAHGS